MGTVERMLGGQGALHRRPTLELRLDPVDLPAATEFLPRLEPQGLIDDPWLALWGHNGMDPTARGPKVLGYSAAATVVTP